MEQNVHIQMIWEDKLETNIIIQNLKSVWISDDIWMSKLEGCRWKQTGREIKCVKTTGLIGILRGYT
jgi:hypothetical protein